MSTVDEWADRYFCREFPLELDTPTHKAFFATGADTLAALLLSDEAVEAVAKELASHVDLIDWDSERRDTGGIQCSCRKWRAEPGADGVRPRAGWHLHLSKAVLQAALTKITEDNE